MATSLACGPKSTAAPRCPEPIPAEHSAAPAIAPEPPSEPLAESPLAKPDAAMHPIDVAGVFETGAGMGLAVVLFEPVSGRVVPIWIGDREAQVISLRLADQRFQRPLTHDLLDAVMDQLRAELLRVEIDALEGGTFLGKLYVRGADGAIHRIDARPSDCIALALGSDAPIYIAQAVLDRAGEPTDFGIDADQLPRPTA